MSWKLLNEEIDRFHNRQKALEQIAEIVAKHPEWFEVEPQLRELLKRWNDTGSSVKKR